MRGMRREGGREEVWGEKGRKVGRECGGRGGKGGKEGGRERGKDKEVWGKRRE